jgi:hypothetical protein
LRRARYVALGSCPFISGLELPPIVDDGCRRSGRNYVRRVADALRLELADITCFDTRTEVRPGALPVPGLGTRRAVADKPGPHAPRRAAS